MSIYSEGETKVCSVCGATIYPVRYESPSHWRDKRYCSKKCFYEAKKGKTAWNKGMKMSSEFCENTRVGHLGQIPWCTGKKQTKEHRKKLSEAHLGQTAWNKGLKLPPRPREEGSNNWKGDECGYAGMHAWVKRMKGKAVQCEDCGRTNCKIEWSNNDHKYHRILVDYTARCTKCHRRYDLSHNLWKKI